METKKLHAENNSSAIETTRQKLACLKFESALQTEQLEKLKNKIDKLDRKLDRIVKRTGTFEESDEEESDEGDNFQATKLV